MKLKQIIKNIDIIEINAEYDAEISGICYDSRAAKPGDLFVAVRGFTVDGHKYIAKAAAAGVAAVLCEQAPEVDIPYILTSDSRKGLALASCEFFGNPAAEMKIIGITGTSGKTTSSYLIKHMLEAKLDAKVGLIGTNGNMIGDEFLHTEHTTPESYELQKLFRRMAEAGCTHVVMEVSSHSLVLDRVAGFDFDVALYTNLSQDHLDFHNTMEEYAQAKRLMFSRCKKACVNMDDDWAGFMLEGADCEILGYSARNSQSRLLADNMSYSASGVSFNAHFEDSQVYTRLAIPGTFSVYNALGVMATGLALGLSLEDCADALGSAKGVKGRLEIVPGDGDYTVIIDYSHKPDALEKVLRSLRWVSKGRLVCLFGCGGDRDRAKRPIMGKIAADNADFVIVTSDNPRTEEPQAIIDEIVSGMQGTATPFKVICDRVEAICWAIDNALPGDVILLAGKGHEDYQVIGHEKHHMDEREIVAEHLAARQRCK